MRARDGLGSDVADGAAQIVGLDGGAAELARGGEGQGAGRRQDHLAFHAGRPPHGGGHGRAELFLGCGGGRPALHDGNDALAVVVTVDGKRSHVARAHALEMLDGPFEILWPDVAAADDDQVLAAAGDHQLAVYQVAEVPGVEPAVLEQHAVRSQVIAVVARHQAGAVDADTADRTLRAR